MQQYNYHGESTQAPRDYGEGHPSEMANEQYQNYTSHHYPQTSSSAPVFPNSQPYYNARLSGQYPVHDSQYYTEGYQIPSYPQQSHGPWYPEVGGPDTNQANWPGNAHPEVLPQYPSQHYNSFDNNSGQLANQGAFGVSQVPHGTTMGPGGHSSQRRCSRCHTTTTNSWGQDPTTGELLCYPCASHRQQRHMPGPSEQATQSIGSGSGMRSQSSKAGQKCTHCGTTNTQTWRRDKDKNLICNACGVYAQVLGKERPLSLAPSVYKPRPKSQNSQNIRFKYYDPNS
ncbi:hypothetical protein K435DRAFT_753780 [Dendrothele bispora CBS 962.96]|uniref:GATA-type domain-containing protein n=1 Tax=Dendrothele bispora (strain CBS 962.96) TaxID=1314807 RepID=A0A4V4HG74_DENBC|nr:hypothetical protein K435DRAFT_753780 [Dendrothele bispora CBS 962.96]